MPRYYIRQPYIPGWYRAYAEGASDSLEEAYAYSYEELAEHWEYWFCGCTTQTWPTHAKPRLRQA